MLLIWRRAATDDGSYTHATMSTMGELFVLGYKATLCIPVPHPFPDTTISLETKIGPTDFFESGPTMIVSKRLRQIFEEFNVKAEFIQVKAKLKKKAYTKKQFYIMNNLDQAPCLDYKRSKYKITASGVEEIEPLVLDESKSMGKHFFRLGPVRVPGKPNRKAIKPIILCVSEQLARRILAEGLTGIMFVIPKDYDDFDPKPWLPPESMRD